MIILNKYLFSAYRIKQIFLFSFIIIVSFSFAQNNKRSNIWYFGVNAGLDFNNGVFPPKPLSDGQINTTEGCASIADEDGQLLFYSDGVSIWDKTHTPMPNASGLSYPTDWDRMLSGDVSSTNSVLIGPVIGEDSKYYVFTTDGWTCSQTTGPKGQWDGLYYSIIDMSLNNGLGDIDTAYIHKLGYPGNKIYLTDSITEKITLAIHQNTYGYWVVAQKYSTGDFYAFQVNCFGVDIDPVVSYAKDFGWFGKVPGVNGCITASRDGKSLAAVYSVSHPENIWLCDFNNTTGKVVNITTLGIDTGLCYGVCFSPNDSILYVKYSNKGQKIQRYKRFTLELGPVINTQSLSSGMQIGPDNRIYMAGHSSPLSLSVIHDPDNFDSPAFQDFAVPLALGTQLREGLPHFFTFHDFTNITTPKLSLSGDTLICLDDTLLLSLDIGVSQGSYLWSTGDTSNTIAVSEEGVYDVLVEVEGCKMMDTVQVDFFDCSGKYLLREIFIPNSFSPDGNGENDIWEIKQPNKINTHVKIYNLLGKLVFESDKIPIIWDGTNSFLNNSDILPNGVYVYFADISFAEDDIVVKQSVAGNVTLIR